MKTHTRTLWQRLETDSDEENAIIKADIAAGFEYAVVQTLLIKCRRALQQTSCQRLVIAGGVGANQSLRSTLLAEAKKRDWEIYYPRPAFCTDNGAMIAYVGNLRQCAGQLENTGIRGHPRWPIDELSPPGQQDMQ